MKPKWKFWILTCSHVISDYTALGPTFLCIKWFLNTYASTLVWTVLQFVHNVAGLIYFTGHYKFHASDYRAGVFELVGKAAMIYAQRRLQSQGLEGPSISESVCNLHKAAASSSESLRRVATDPSDHFFLPSSMEYEDKKDTNLQKGELFHPQNMPSINAHGVLGQILFDICVPKNIEGWDIKPSTSLNGRQTFAVARRHGLFYPMKCIRRSRL